VHVLLKRNAQILFVCLYFINYFLKKKIKQTKFFLTAQMQRLQQNAQMQTDAVSDELANLQMEKQELNGK
jgi:hypothetical protein